MEEYERLKEYSENIVESINVGILAADLDDRVESWNTRMEQLTGIPRGDARRAQLAELFPGDLCEQFSGARRKRHPSHLPVRAARRTRPATSSRCQLHGTERPSREGSAAGQAPETLRETIVNVAVAPLVSKDLEQIGRLIIFDDITERDELERRLVQADKLSSDRTAGGRRRARGQHAAGGDIRHTPRCWPSRFRATSRNPACWRRSPSRPFAPARSSIRCLNFSRTSPTALVEVDLNRVIQESLLLIEHQIEKAGIKVNLDLEEQIPSIQGNSGKLQQVFLNLFLNARDAMGTGRHSDRPDPVPGRYRRVSKWPIPATASSRRT